MIDQDNGFGRFKWFFLNELKKKRSPLISATHNFMESVPSHFRSSEHRLEISHLYVHALEKEYGKDIFCRCNDKQHDVIYKNTQGKESKISLKIFHKGEILSRPYLIQNNKNKRLKTKPATIIVKRFVASKEVRKTKPSEEEFDFCGLLSVGIQKVPNSSNYKIVFALASKENVIENSKISNGGIFLTLDNNQWNNVHVTESLFENNLKDQNHLYKIGQALRQAEYDTYLNF